MLTLLNAIYADQSGMKYQLETLVPITTTTLQHVDDGSVINSIMQHDAAVWLLGVFCAFVFIMGWRAAE